MKSKWKYIVFGVLAFAVLTFAGIVIWSSLQDDDLYPYGFTISSKVKLVALKVNGKPYPISSEPKKEGRYFIYQYEESELVEGFRSIKEVSCKNEKGCWVTVICTTWKGRSELSITLE